MIKFEFEKAYEEIDINGKVYKMYLGDDSLKSHHKAMDNFYNEIKEIQKIDLNNASMDEQHKVLDDTRELVKEFINQLLGENSFDTLYEESGKSVYNLVMLIDKLSDVIKERAQKQMQEKKNKYVKNKYKNNKKPQYKKVR